MGGGFVGFVGFVVDGNEKHALETRQACKVAGQGRAGQAASFVGTLVHPAFWNGDVSLLRG